MPGITLNTCTDYLLNPHEVGIHIIPVLWMRIVRVQDLRQLAHSYTAHLVWKVPQIIEKDLGRFL